MDCPNCGSSLSMCVCPPDNFFGKGFAPKYPDNAKDAFDELNFDEDVKD